MYIGSQEHRDNLNKAREAALASRVSCRHCAKLFIKSNISKHEISCDVNPANLSPCEVCGKLFKSRTRQGKPDRTVCSTACHNVLRRGDLHPNWKQDSYRSTALLYHKRKCVVCAEDNTVEVHHLDGDKGNNSPQNLIPLCPTHHRYWHSRYRHLIESTVLSYQERWIEENPLFQCDVCTP